ncbi:hypothetical protein M2119_000694 [Aurantimicrobium minutum]|uniref:DUF6036 family nucleotidyltransferase n=1 Tax=Aurantimicrobium minutum TaxID=708131 RepID=UPI002473D8C4|nr:DUF6036 family nucleotidyltransferase [Aurantimicrobium minutum]MDH6532457.1 hypothetical protein [Aurantimicrobium minutum]
MARPATLDYAALIELFTAMGEGLERKHATATVYVFGGAAMLMHGLRRGMTEDIDVYSLRSDSLRETVAQLTAEYDLAPEWVSSTGSGFVPGPGTDELIQEKVFGGLTVQIASPRNLLAHKLTALRPKDLDDLHELMKINEISHSSQALAIVTELYDEETNVPQIKLEDIERWVSGWLARHS